MKLSLKKLLVHILRSVYNLEQKGWKHLQTVSGRTSVDVSTINFEELFIESIYGNVHYTKSIPRVALPSSGTQVYFDGMYATSSNNRACWWNLGRSSVALVDFYVNASNVAPNTTTAVYYR